MYLFSRVIICCAPSRAKLLNLDNFLIKIFYNPMKNRVQVDDENHTSSSGFFNIKSQNDICLGERTDLGIIMGKESFHFQLGAFRCMVVNDGNVAYSDPAQIFFVNAPKDRLKKVLRDYNLDITKLKEYVSPYQSLLINTDQQLVLVDTGAGDMEPTTGKLILNLRAEGIAPEDIDTVILTHAHADHIGGNIDREGKPAFRNASYIMWKNEWDFWISKPKLAALDISESDKEWTIKYARDHLLPIQDQLDLVDHETEIAPGIWVVAAFGHTPGHMAVYIISDNKQLLCISDAVIHQIHLEQPEWYTSVDLAPEQVITTRRQLLDRATTEKALVHAFHFPFPGLGYVIQKGDGWQWQPMR
jgi:glyoxylase-like metal-dependent hydrolase (beta-lactamase superfamily II)